MSILVLGDTHFPWVDEPSLKEVIKLAKTIKPESIIQVGDLYDMYAFSSYRKTLNELTPQQEITEGQKMAKDMWAKLKKAAPKAYCWQLLGNHDIRGLNRCLEKLPEMSSLVQCCYMDLFSFKGVTTAGEPAQEVLVNPGGWLKQPVVIMHGHRKMGEHAAYNKMNTVHGHTHKGGLVYTPLGHWELDVGWLGDRKAHCFSYKSQKVLDGTTKGVGLIDRLGPRFIPFETPRDLEKESLVIKGR